MELEDASAIGRFSRTVEIDPVDDADERVAERHAVRDRTEDVAEERDSFRRVQLGRADLFLAASYSDRRPTGGAQVAHPVAQTYRLPDTSIIAFGFVRGCPLVRPRMVMSPLNPSGTRAARRNLAIGAKNVTQRGALAVLLM